MGHWKGCDTLSMLQGKDSAAENLERSTRLQKHSGNVNLFGLYTFPLSADFKLFFGLDQV